MGMRLKRGIGRLYHSKNDTISLIGLVIKGSVELIRAAAAAAVIGTVVVPLLVDAGQGDPELYRTLGIGALTIAIFGGEWCSMSIEPD